MITMISRMMSTEAHDEILVHCGFLCESPESLLFRRRVIEEANGFYKNYAEYTHDNAIYRLNVIEEYQAFSNINNKEASNEKVHFLEKMYFEAEQFEFEFVKELNPLGNDSTSISVII